MKTRLRTGAFLSIWLVAAAFVFAAPSSSSLAFTVSMDDPASHIFHVALRCEGLRGEAQDFKMPVWMPGYYGIIDYAGQVQDFKAVDGSGKPLDWDKPAVNTWRVQTRNASALTISYGVKATIRFIVHSLLDEGHAYIAPVGVFIYPAGQIGHPVTVRVNPGKKWKDIATGLDPVPGKPGTFSAPDFDVLYDCPILVGNLERLTFDVRGIPHEFVGWNLGDFDRPAFTADLKRVVEAAVSVIGEIPYKHYSFLAVGPGQGGIEHANSQADSLDTLSGYSAETKRRTLSFLAHEFFHLYNVKRIRPVELGPFDYDRPNRTRLLWVSEGFTVYYEYIILRRAGFLTPDELLDSLGSPIAGYENRPGRLVQSAAQSSYESWDQGPFGGDPQTSISYYDKGSGLALLLDLAIRHETGGAKSLDDVMRALYRDYYKEKGRGFSDAEFQETCEQLAGAPLREIFEYVDTTKAVDYPKYLGYAGLDVELPRELDEGDLGALIGERDGKVIVWRAPGDSPAGRAGLKTGDVIVALDGIPVNLESLKKAVAAKKPGDTVVVRYSRDGAEKEVSVVLARKIDPGYRIKRIPNPAPEQEKIYRGWVGGD
jgi:predicted metalloprotease with PDZ domain